MLWYALKLTPKLTNFRLQIANLCNSTVIEMYGDIIRVSQRLRGCQMLEYIADAKKKKSSFWRAIWAYAWPSGYSDETVSALFLLSPVLCASSFYSSTFPIIRVIHLASIFSRTAIKIWITYSPTFGIFNFIHFFDPPKKIILFILLLLLFAILRCCQTQGSKRSKIHAKYDDWGKII